MTAAPEPEGRYDDDPLAQVAIDVDALRRRVDEHGALLRRNQASMTQLAESVGKVVEQGRRRERRQILNSFVAYLLFTVLLGGGALFIYRTRSADLERARNDALSELTTARRDLKAAQGLLAARDAASDKAYAFYQLVRDGKRADAVAQYVDVSQLALTPTEREVFADGAKQARAKMVDAGWQSGLEAFHKGDFAKAVTELRRAANYESGGANTPQLHYHLGVALVKTKDPNGAIDELQAALAAKVDQTGETADARYWLAVALEGAGKPDQARREYEKFAAAQPMAPMAAMARQRWVVIGQQLAAKKAP